MNHEDHFMEPVRGLPAKLPEGEHILWQGQPHTATLGRHLFNVNAVGVYFGLLAVWGAASTIADGRGVADAAVPVAGVVIMGAAAIAVLMVLAWAIARTTVYTITNRRVVMRIGVALSVTFNLPFKEIESAHLKEYGNAAGNISLKLRGDNKIAYLQLWPHARPWRLRHPEPTLRCIPNASEVARALSKALADFVADPEAESDQTARGQPGRDAGPSAEPQSAARRGMPTLSGAGQASAAE